MDKRVNVERVVAETWRRVEANKNDENCRSDTVL